jgi:hypothetical protein
MIWDNMMNALPNKDKDRVSNPGQAAVKGVSQDNIATTPDTPDKTAQQRWLQKMEAVESDDGSEDGTGKSRHDAMDQPTVTVSSARDLAVVAALAESKLPVDLLRLELQEVEQGRIARSEHITELEKAEAATNAAMGAAIQRDAQLRLESKQAKRRAAAKETELKAVRAELAALLKHLQEAEARIAQLEEDVLDGVINSAPDAEEDAHDHRMSQRDMRGVDFESRFSHRAESRDSKVRHHLGG